jgi:transposase, IS6 family
LGFGLRADDGETPAPISQAACGSVRVDEAYIKIRRRWRYLYHAIDKFGNPVDFLLTAKRDLEAAKHFFREMLKDEPPLSADPVHHASKHLQQGIESDHFR